MAGAAFANAVKAVRTYELSSIYSAIHWKFPTTLTTHLARKIFGRKTALMPEKGQDFPQITTELLQTGHFTSPKVSIIQVFLHAIWPKQCPDKICGVKETSDRVWLDALLRRNHMTASRKAQDLNLEEAQKLNDFQHRRCPRCRHIDCDGSCSRFAGEKEFDWYLVPDSLRRQPKKNKERFCFNKENGNDLQRNAISGYSQETAGC